MTEIKKVKITVFRTNFYEDLMAEYGTEGLGVCELHAPGQVFYSNGWQKPTGLCDNAWNCMQDYVLAISQGCGLVYGRGNWCNREDMCIVGCNDGLRTVIFKVERTDETAEVFEEN